MARSNTLQYMILGLLSRKPMTGYDIKQTFDQEKAEFWTAPFSQIYPELNRLLKAELIALIMPQEASRKKTYQLTTDGHTLFKEWLLAPLNQGNTQLDNDNFILRLHFLGSTDEKVLKHLLNLRCQTLRIEVAQLELELNEVVNHPEQLGRQLIIEKELTNKKAELILWQKQFQDN